MYSIMINGMVRRASDGACINPDGTNKDAAEYKDWLDEGNEPEVEQEPEITMDEVRARRNALISATDWTQMPDSPLSDADKATYATYRQKLRDVPQQIGAPLHVVWPEKP